MRYVVVVPSVYIEHHKYHGDETELFYTDNKAEATKLCKLVNKVRGKSLTINEEDGGGYCTAGVAVLIDTQRKVDKNKAQLALVRAMKEYQEWAEALG